MKEALTMKLYSYYRSSAAYRVRIALNYKQLDYELIPVSLLKDEQSAPAYIIKNPEARVPLLEEGDHQISQSLAIMEYLDEQYPSNPLLPKDILHRAWVRSIADLVACDMHPLNNLGVLKYLTDELAQDESHKMQWYHHWLKRGFDALEQKLQSTPIKGRLCLGDTVTMADICLVPQVYNALRFDFKMNNYCGIMRICQYAETLPAFIKAMPENQPDAK